MRICVPTEDDRGLAASVFGHFGSAPFFTIHDTDTGTTEVIDNSDRDHVHGQCSPTEALGDAKVDVLLVGGLGRRALDRLCATGVRVHIAPAGTVGDAVAALQSGSLLEMSPYDACAGHGHAH